MSESRVEQWKRKLLDLSLRNPLLNMRDGLKLLPITAGTIFKRAATGTEIVPYQAPEIGKDIPLRAQLTEKEIGKRLKELYLTSRSLYNESGVNSLFLAVGCLNWNEKDGEELRHAPLMLIPAQLIRQTAAPGYRLQRTDEDAVVNFCIVEMLRSQFGIPIRDIDGGGFGDGDPDFNEVFRTFADAIQNRREWSITTDVALGIFSFSKVVIWRDLTDHIDAFKKQPFVAHLAEGTGLYDDHVTVFPQHEVEKHIQPDKLYCPMSADSSQLAAVLYSEAGKSFVLHGPPGTGKSQTITNIIAHNLALGKRVLFVSEKKAALDVVYKRLASCGLAPFCLELHSNKADKINVMRQFAEALATAESPRPSQWETLCARVMSAFTEIGAYVKDLHRQSANGMSVFDCVARRMEKHPQADAALISFNAAATSPAQLAAIGEIIRSVADEWKGVDREAYDALAIVPTEEWSPLFEEKVAKDADALLAAVSDERPFMRRFKVLGGMCKATVRGTFAASLVFDLFDDVLLRQKIENAKDHLEGLRLVLSYRNTRTRAVKAKCRTFIEAMEAGKFASQDATRVFADSCAEKTLNTLISSSHALRGFSGVKHEERISRFRELDGKWTDAAQQVIIATLSKRLHEIEHPPKKKDAEGRWVEQKMDPTLKQELAVLKRECEKKKRFMPIRKLLSETPHVSMRLKPCFLMSPLSVAQYLPADDEPFDLVVFDEASQMTVWDAVGVIARGKQLIVVGDPKQLPPTNFFVKGDVKAEDREDDSATEDLESVLDECLANGLHSAYLNWHYRSRHESLIAFSNRHYYEDRLNTFPAASMGDKLGVSFHYVEGGRYDHVSHTNRKEAEAIVAYLFERLKDSAERKRSWGIVTFSVAQQRLIWDLIDARSAGCAWAADFFDDAKPDAFFVKNLENVQGDERDVIMFSVAYAPDDQGRFVLSFGPVNRPGGERRLNVAVTRAREKVVLFASVRGSDIHTEKTNSIGVKHLKALMDYAESGHLEGESENAKGSGCEGLIGIQKSVCAFLKQHGYSFDVTVGRSSFPIDIAVRNPEDPSQYILGIECDGKRYADQRTVRDRDILRGDVLAGLGWKIVRIWSIDWAFDRKTAEKRLLEVLPPIAAHGE